MASTPGFEPGPHWWEAIPWSSFVIQDYIWALKLLRSSVATGSKDGYGLKLEKIVAMFSNFNAISCKNHQNRNKSFLTQFV